jgi:hypothetical protein
LKNLAGVNSNQSWCEFELKLKVKEDFIA